MFSLYGMSGPIVQGTLESLARLPPIKRRGLVSPASRISSDESSSLDTLNTRVEHEKPSEAIQAYESMRRESLERGPLYVASQIMQREVIAAQAQDDVASTWQLLLKKGIHQAPVLDENGHLVGIVSERHLLTALNVVEGKIRDALASQVKDVMASPVVAADPATDIRRIAQVMVNYGVDGVPVVNDRGSLLGFISRTDILNAIVTDPPLSLWR